MNGKMQQNDQYYLLKAIINQFADMLITTLYYNLYKTFVM